MDKIITIEHIAKLSKKLRTENKKVVLAGGCFDIVHLGHIHFLQQAKLQGDILIVWVESDQTVTERKGKNRPIHSQIERAQLLAALACIDNVLVIPYLKTDKDYLEVVKKVKPAIITATEGDPGIVHKQRAAEAVDAKVVFVAERIAQKSSSNLAQLLEQEKYL